MKEFYSVKELAALLPCSCSALRKWIAEGRLPTVRAGRLVRIRRDDLERFLNETSQISSIK